MAKVLLIQIRKDKKVSEQEYKSFLRKAKSCGIVLDRINVCHQNLEVKKVLEVYSHILIGGSAFSVKDKFKQKNKVNKLILEAVETNKPLLGICFGFQLIVEALGGKVVKSAKTKEFGTKLVSAIKPQKEKIFSKMPRTFYVQEAHEWSASKMPANSVLIAKGKNVLCQGIRVVGKPAFGFQFHAELTKKDMIERTYYYNDTDKSFNFSKVDFKKLRASRFSEKIITNFFRKF